MACLRGLLWPSTVESVPLFTLTQDGCSGYCDGRVRQGWQAMEQFGSSDRMGAALCGDIDVPIWSSPPT